MGVELLGNPQSMMAINGGDAHDTKRVEKNHGIWQERLDLNQRIPESKSGALPLGYAPILMALLPS